MTYECGKIYADIIQGTPEWFDVKRGKVGASKINDIMAKLKNGQPGAGRKNFAARLVCERLTGTTEETFSNSAMQWGVEQEANARSVYEFHNDVVVDQVGFIDHPTVEFAGMSPDGMVGEDGLLEIKCPNTSTHIDYLLKGVMPSEYVNQVQWQMACSGRLWCDFVSYDPRMPFDLQMFIIRVGRDNEKIAEIEKEVVKLNQEVSETIEQLKGLSQCH